MIETVQNEKFKKNGEQKMQVHFREQTLTRIRQVSQEIGVQEENFIRKAVLYYLDTIQEQFELKLEMNEWDKLSDEALTNFEEMLALE